MSWRTWPEKLMDVKTLEDAETLLKERKPNDNLFTAFKFLCQRMDVQYFELLQREINLSPVLKPVTNVLLYFLDVAVLEGTLLKKAFKEGHVDIVRYFLDNGLPLTERILKYTPLMWAVDGQKLDVVDVILEHHIAITEERNVRRRAKDKQELSPVDLLYFQAGEGVDAIAYAVVMNSVDILRRFYIHGADFARYIESNVYSSYGKNVAKVNSYFSLAYFVESLHVMNYLTGLGVVSDEMIRQCKISGVVNIINSPKSTDDVCEEHLFLQRYVRCIPNEEDLNHILACTKRRNRQKIVTVLEEEIARRAQ